MNFELSEEQEVYIKKGIQDIEQGKTVSHEEVMTRAKTWLSEK
jgi:predicted transcriptional regulator